MKLKSMHADAQRLHKLGLPVLPVNQNKTPGVDWKDKQPLWKKRGQTLYEIGQLFKLDTWGIGVLLYPYSDLVVLDKDGPCADLLLKNLQIPSTVTNSTPNGIHCFFKVPKELRSQVKRRVRFLKDPPGCKCAKPCGIDLLIEGYVIVPPSPGYQEIVGGKKYAELPEILLMPEWVVSDDGERSDAEIEKPSKVPARQKKPPKIITEGQRNMVLATEAIRLRRSGYTVAEIYPAIAQMNKDRCQPPLSDAEVERIVFTKQSYDPLRSIGSMSNEQQDAAMVLLRSPDLLEQFLDHTEKMLCTGERSNKLILYLAMTSRLLTRPICLIIKGESSSGKNFVTTMVGKFMPFESITQITTATTKSLYYLPGSLKHKILIFAESAGGEDSDYAKRSLISEGSLRIWVAVKGEGGIVTEEKTVEGPICIIETSTRGSLNIENQTRVFDLHIDESEEQTERIYAAQDRSHELDDPDATFLDVWHNAQRLLETIKVRIPYVKHVRLPLKPIRVRRDRLRFLALIESITLLHQHQRERITTSGGQTYLLSNLDDYELALPLASELLEASLTGLTPKGRTVLTWAQSFGADFTRKELMKGIGWAYNTVRRHLENLLTQGYVEELSRPGKETIYSMTSAPDVLKSMLPSREQMVELMLAHNPAQSQ